VTDIFAVWPEVTTGNKTHAFAGGHALEKATLL